MNNRLILANQPDKSGNYARCLLLVALAFAFFSGCGSSGMSGGNASSEVNNSPQAIIMVNQTEISAGSEIVLDGTVSFDPEGETLTYRWYECEEYLLWLQNMEYEEDSPYYLSCDGNAQTGLLNIPSVPGLQSDLGQYAEGPTQAVTFPDDGDGEYTFILVVNDGELDSPPRDVIINVTPAPSASRPFAMAFADPTSGVSGAKIILNGSKSEASTAGRTISEYQWYENAANPQLNLIKKVALLPYASGVTQAVWPVTPGTYRFTLIVIDSGGTYSSPYNNDEVQITVSALNSTPTASAGLNRVVKRGELVTLNGSGSSDPDSGTTLLYSWSLSSRPSGSSASLSNPTTQQPSFTPDVSGNYVATLVVNDGQLSSPPASVSIQCNFPPYPNAGANQTVAIGELVTLDGSGSFDADLDPITYSWAVSVPAGSVASLNSLIVARPTFVPDREGSYILRLALNDGLENSDYPAWVTVTALNRRPVAVAKANPNPASLAGTVQLNGSSSYDPDGYPVKWAWSLRSRPAGSSAVITYPTAVTPTFVADLVGNFLIKLVVNDGFIDSYADWITVTATNLRPKAVAKASPSQLALSQTTTLNGSQSYDPDGNITTYLWQKTSGPAVTISSPASASTGTGAFASAGSYVFKLTVTDNGGLTYSDWTTVTVIANQAPLAVARATPDILSLGLATTLDGTDSFDPDGTIATYLWQKTSGPAATISNPANASTGTGAFASADTYVFKLTVTDNSGLTYSDWTTVTVINLPPQAAARAIPTNPTIGNAIILDGTRSSDPEGSALTYLWDKPWWDSSGVTISSPNNSSTLTGTFPAAVTYAFVLTVTDNGGLQSRDLVIVSPQAGGGPANTRPNADAKVNGLDQANAGFYESVTLDGRFSFDPDPTDSIVFYSWQQVSGLPVNLEMTEWPKAVTFTAPDEIGNLVFSLVVSDGKSLSYPDYVTVSVWRSVFTASQMGNRFINDHLGQPAGLFVSQSPKAEDVPYCGDPVTSPCKTISYAIHNRWPTTVTADVYVGTWNQPGDSKWESAYSGSVTGTYKENVVLYDASAKRGVSVFGGFFDNGTGNWWRELDRYPKAVTISANNPSIYNGAVSCDTTFGTVYIANLTFIDGFRITGDVLSVTDHPAVLCDSSLVTIRNNNIEGKVPGANNNWAIVISDNNAWACGSGIGANTAGSPKIINNIIDGGGKGATSASYGICFHLAGSSSLVVNNFIYGGSPNPGNSCGIYVYGATNVPVAPILLNNIIDGGNGTTNRYGIYEAGSYNDPETYYNDIRINVGAGTCNCLYWDVDTPAGGGCLAPPEPRCKTTKDELNTSVYLKAPPAALHAGNNISADPKFLDELNGNYHLNNDSPCIDAGTDAGIRSDLGGNKRPVDVKLNDGTDVDNNPLDSEHNVFDIGPYEYPNAVSQP